MHYKAHGHNNLFRISNIDQIKKVNLFGVGLRSGTHLRKVLHTCEKKSSHAISFSSTSHIFQDLGPDYYQTTRHFANVFWSNVLLTFSLKICLLGCDAMQSGKETSFWRTCWFHLQGIKSFCTKEQCSGFLSNCSTFLSEYTVSHPRDGNL
jgi:hypothetical protein